jgi:hypothetical protein
VVPENAVQELGMKTIIKKIDPADPALDTLVERSHQTSLYVLREWREAIPSYAILGAYTNDALEAAMFVEKGPLPLPFIGYRGVLLTRREQVPVLTALLAEAEKIPHACVWNAPAMVDVRPFFWRYPVLWKTDIRYTIFLDRTCRPFRELADIPLHESAAQGSLPDWAIDDVAEVFEKVQGLSSVLTYTAGDGTIMIGQDAQGRGYYVAGWGPEVDSMVWSAAAKFPSLDLGGANSARSASRKRVYGGRLRTSYKLFL